VLVLASRAESSELDGAHTLTDRPRPSVNKSRYSSIAMHQKRADNSGCSFIRSKGRLSQSTFGPKASSNCLVRLSASTISDAGTTGSLSSTTEESPLNTPSSTESTGALLYRSGERPCKRSRPP
jgi:hypothetical protein